MATLPPEDALSGESVVHCFQSEKRGIPEPGSRIPTDGQIWPEQIGKCDRITSESMVGLGRNMQEEARSDIFDYIEMFYNSKRRHGSSDQMPPTEYENQYYQRLGSV